MKNIVKEYPLGDSFFRAVDDVSFTVNDGEIFGIIGLSGAGKSTLVRCINRLEEPESGDVLIDGVSVLGLDKKGLLEERKQIGMIFQSFNLFEQKNVFENIAYPLRIMKMDNSEIKARVEELLDFIDLKHKRNSYPRELSGGQKQRVAIARAIATKPKILLSDEGTSALDPANTKSILDLLKSIVEKFNMTVIMITHQMEVAKEICDRIAVMERGKIIEENTVEEIFRNPKEKLTASFIYSLQDKGEKVQEDINKDDFSGVVARLTYGDKDYSAPILSSCIKKFDVDVSILSGNVNKLNRETVGYLIIEINGEQSEIFKAMDYLREQDVRVEVL